MKKKIRDDLREIYPKRFVMLYLEIRNDLGA